MILAFELSMPSNNSWNGKWSGEDRCYARVVNVGSAKKVRAKYEPILDHKRYTYSFDDGWVAAVTVREVTTAEANKMRKKTVGFCGYDWMIDSIRMHGEIRA